jgi:glutamyl-tRNA synthetase
VPSTPVSFEDGFTGSCRSNVADEVGDFLILRRNATPAYQLAVTVDDAEQGVNEVLRGQDLLPSTARQYLLQRALGLPHPRWYHVPLVVDESGRRLAKRHGDTSIAELRQAGVDPRAIVAWVARSAGVAVSARVTAREILDTFDLRRVPREAVVLSARSLGELRSETA